MSDQTLQIMYYVLFIPPVVLFCGTVLYLCFCSFFVKPEERIMRPWSEEEKIKYGDPQISDLIVPFAPLVLKPIVCAFGLAFGYAIGSKLFKEDKK